jgi:L-threonylcarbamoyladenylate synthase
VVGVPTDTVYGLAARAGSPEGCAALFRLKGRPPAVALPVLVGEVEAALELAAPSARPALEAVARALWPGPLTVVVAAARPLVHLGGDGTTVGLRLPDDKVVAALCKHAGPLAVTSANRHGGDPCTSADEVLAAFPVGLAAVLDGGRRAGAPSSVVALRDGEVVVLRPGPVGAEDVRRALAPIRDREAPR